MTGRTYLERGRPVVVLARWATPIAAAPCPPGLVWHHPPRRPPRNVLIARDDGERVVWPFHGLRRLPVDAADLARVEKLTSR